MHTCRARRPPPNSMPHRPAPNSQLNGPMQNSQLSSCPPLKSQHANHAKDIMVECAEEGYTVLSQGKGDSSTSHCGRLRGAWGGRWRGTWYK